MKINFLAVFFASFFTPLVYGLHSIPTHYASFIIPPIITDQYDIEVSPGFDLTFYEYYQFGENSFNFCNPIYCDQVESALGLPVSSSLTEMSIGTSFITNDMSFGTFADFGLTEGDLRFWNYSELFAFKIPSLVVVNASGVSLPDFPSEPILAPLISGGTQGQSFVFHRSGDEDGIFLPNAVIELFDTSQIIIDDRSHYLRQVYDGVRNRTDLYLYDVTTRQNILVASNSAVPVPASAWLFLSAFGGLLGARKFIVR